MRLVWLLSLGCFLVFSPLARAEVASTAPGGFVIQASAHVDVRPEQAWGRLTEIGQWWSGTHTYSGDAANLSLEARAGGCWCERWGEGQSVEHARVVMVLEHEGVRTLRLVGGLGPLQEMGAGAVLSFVLSPDSGGTRLQLTYRVAGDPGLGLAEAAPAVDTVLMEQFARLSHYLAYGTPS